MEPPLGIAGLPARTAQPRPGRRSQTRRGNPQAHPARPLFATVKSRRSIAILNRQPSRENLTTFRSAPNPSQRLPDEPVCGYAMFPRLPSPGPLWAVATLAPERFAHLRRLSLALLLSALPVTGAGGAFLPRQGLGVFRHAWVSETRSQTLNSGEKHYG